MKNILFFIIYNFLYGIILIYSFDINREPSFTKPYRNDGEYVYFSSFIEEFHSEEKDFYVVFYTANEICKFLNIKIEYSNETLPIGSFVLYNAKVNFDYPIETVEEIINYIKPMPYKMVNKYGTLSSVKIKNKDLEELWNKYNNNNNLPDYQEIIEKIEKDYPLWYFDIPEYDGYIFGLGIGDTMSTITKNTMEADINAITEIINTLNIKIYAEDYSYNDKYSNLFFQASRQDSIGSLSGIAIIKRIYLKKYNAVFSLAVLKL